MASGRFKTHFMSGLLLLAPAFFTILLVSYLLRLADHFIVDPIFAMMNLRFDVYWKVFCVKVTIGLAVLVAIALVGMLTEKFIFRRVFESGDQLMIRIPMLNRVYLTFKEISQAIFGDKSGIFRRVVFIEYPRKGIYTLGFVTQDKPWHMECQGGLETVGVFVPSPPNPASGYVVFVPKIDVIESNMTTEEAIRLVVSAGAVVPPKKKS